MIEYVFYSLHGARQQIEELKSAAQLEQSIVEMPGGSCLDFELIAGSPPQVTAEAVIEKYGIRPFRRRRVEATPEELATSEWFSNVGCRWIEDDEKQLDRPRYTVGDCRECGSDRRRHLDPLRGTFGSLRKFHLVRKPQALFLFSTRLAALAEERGWTGVEIRPVLDRKTDAPSDLFKEAWITSILPPMHASAGIVRFKPCPYCETCKRIGYQLTARQAVYSHGALDGSADWNLSSEWLAPHLVPCPKLICSRRVVHELLKLEPTQKWIPVKFVDD